MKKSSNGYIDIENRKRGLMSSKIPGSIKVNLDKNNESLKLILKQENINEKILELLSENEEFAVRDSIAGNPNTPIHILEKLSNDEDYNVREFVVKNPRTPIHVLEKLSNDKNINVRSLVAQNTNWINY